MCPDRSVRIPQRSHCTLENPCDGNEGFHNCFNYHRKFSDSEKEENKKVAGLFLQSFKVLDWWGRIWKPEGQTMKYCSKCELVAGENGCRQHPKARLITRQNVATMPNIEFPVPWTHIMKALCLDLLPYKDVLVIEQIKEKFGGLRVYFSVQAQPEGSKSFRAFDEVNAIIEKHEKEVESLYEGLRKG